MGEGRGERREGRGERVEGNREKGRRGDGETGRRGEEEKKRRRGGEDVPCRQIQSSQGIHLSSCLRQTC